MVILFSWGFNKTSKVHREAADSGFLRGFQLFSKQHNLFTTKRVLDLKVMNVTILHVKVSLVMVSTCSVIHRFTRN